MQMAGTTSVVESCSKTDVYAKILSTKSRRADLNGHDLQLVHAEIGKTLAVRVLNKVENELVQERAYKHVQEGKTFVGPTICAKGVLILPLMRGGEPMSRGVFESLPGARIFHYYDTVDDATLEKALQGTRLVIVVDSVINKGNSVRRILP